jgi:hypothetical protein
VRFGGEKEPENIQFSKKDHLFATLSHEVWQKRERREEGVADPGVGPG